MRLPFGAVWPRVTCLLLIAGIPAVGKLFSKICQLVAEERYLVGLHATERLEERGIMEWQVVAGLADGQLIRERLRSRPNPVVEVREVLPEGTEVTAVWAYLPGSDAAKLVTVHFLDKDR